MAPFDLVGTRARRQDEWRQAKTNVPDLILRYIGEAVTTYRVISDHLGSPIMAVNVNDASDVPFAAEYSAFGERTVNTGASSEDWLPFGFAGGLYDADTRLVRFGERDYDPAVGRWSAKDSIRWNGGVNFYVYANNDPANLIDQDGRLPSGRCLDSIAKGCREGASGVCPNIAFTICLVAAITDETFGSGGYCEPERKDDCAQQCLPYLGVGVIYPGSDGHMYRNDNGGAWAFNRCVAECRGMTIN